MADVRTLKLNLLADVDQFGRSLSQADNDTKGFTNNIKKYGKIAAGAFAAAAAAAGAFAVAVGIDSVKAAAEDEKSSRILEEQLKKTVGANDEMVASVENYISRTQERIGVQDDKLRPAFGRLLRSTEDVTKAQELLNIATDISVATGKDLDTVATALAKSYDGNDTALGRLGLGIDNSILKTGDFDDIMVVLKKNFEGFADKEAKTFEGQLRLVNIQFDEAKEKIGYQLLPVMGNLLTMVTDVSKGFSGDDPQGLSTRARELAGHFEGDGGAYSLGGSLRSVADAFGRLFAEINSTDAVTGASTLERIASALETFAKAIDSVTSAYEGYMTFYNKVPDALKNFMNPFSRLGDYINFAGGRAAGGSVMANQAYRVGEFGPETFVPSGSGSIRPAASNGGGVTVIMNGIIDGESARRSIEKLLQDSARRTGAVNFVGATL
jgi:hypothetical protein